MTDNFNLLSEEQLDSISSGKLWTFHGGIHPQENKLQSNQHAILDAGIPATLVIPVEHKGHVPELLVQVGDMVLKGQPLTKVYGAMVVQHASSSGNVIAIEKRCDLHPSGLSVLSVVIQTDGLDRAVEYIKPLPFNEVAPAILVEKIQQAGIVGMGGAGFPSHLKLAHHDGIKLLIINAAECEPYITADDRLIQEQAYEIIEGVAVLNHILQPKLTIIAIEDNKSEAIKNLQEALQNSPYKDKIIIRVIPTKYPSGSEKQLIEVLTGKQTPVGKHPIELGIVMQNIGTVFAIKQAIIDAKPLTSRIVTLTGGSLQKQGNVSVRIGTPIQYLLDRYWVDSMAVQQNIIGGPMMGFTIENTAAPVTKTCNCILAPTIKEMPSAPAEMPCIRCSECADACPANLLPQQLLWYSKSQDHDKLNDYNLSACIECGACAYVCSSHIPLVEYFRVAKAEINTAKIEAQKTETARIRHENREARLEQVKLDRQAKHKAAAEKRKAQMKEKNGGEDLIAAALARAKAKKSEDPDKLATETEKPVKKNDAVAAAIARAKAKKTALAGNSDKSELPISPQLNLKKSAVEAAVARAKAKKTAITESKESTQAADIDPKKAAVAAAVARAKAKKAAQAENTQPTETTEVDPKKAAVAAAVARAKAKKAAQTETVDVDPRKAAVAAAVARAKAKKAEKALATETKTDEPDNSEVIQQRKQRKEQARLHKQEKEQLISQPEVTEKTEPTAAEIKKAKIAAAVARAKAKKVQAAKNSENEEQK
ncbi:MAG: electron transport complex subunit RsxC [Psychromonas sp.]|nr:electron transport complex subunit RsxC [Psychromonas sp.]